MTDYPTDLPTLVIGLIVWAALLALMVWFGYRLNLARRAHEHGVVQSGTVTVFDCTTCHRATAVPTRRWDRSLVCDDCTNEAADWPLPKDAGR